MKSGWTLDNNRGKVKFEFDKICSGRTRTSSDRKIKNSITQKLINYFYKMKTMCLRSSQIKLVSLKKIALIERKPRPKSCLFQTADVIELMQAQSLNERGHNRNIN